MGQPPFQSYQPPVPPAKPKRSRTARILIWAGAAFAAFLLLGGILNAVGVDKKADTASTAVRTTAPQAVVSSASPAAPVAAAAVRSSAPSVPANGGSYPNAAAILSKLDTAGLTCTAQSPMASANVFYPGATSMTACNSPGGSQQDTSAEVFDTAAHVAEYRSDLASDMQQLQETTGIVTGLNWAVDSTNLTYAQKVRAKLGGQYAVLGSSNASASPSSSAPLGAGPLGAYTADGNETFCDQSTAYWTSDGHGGVEVVTSFNSSGILNISATSKNGAADTSASYTQGTQETGHEFDLNGLAPDNVNEIDFGVTSPLGGGDCQVQPLSK